MKVKLPIRNLFSCLILLTLALEIPAQLNQTVRGLVRDADSKTSLPGAAVSVWKDSLLIQGVFSDENGIFRIENVPVGRVSIQATYLGYQPIFLNNIMVTTGKEVVLNLELSEKYVTATTVVISSGARTEAKNEMATVSTRPFTIEETQRYAGTKNDPARMAQNFAGVTGANDQRNDLVIRGNSPTGLLWRLEGVDIPNPNHFATFGTTGGPISMLNNNMLSNSDFFTSAFPAEYGNALSGVFDLRMRNGNNEQREFTGQFGMNGVELMAEGPFSKNKKYSYLLAFRYNNLAIYKKIGIKFGSSSVPTFTDMSFKLNFPTERLGNFSVFGIGGYSEGKALESERDSADFYGPTGSDIIFHSGMAAGGLVHTFPINDKSFVRSTLAGTWSNMSILMDTLERITKIASGFYRNYSTQGKISFNSFYSLKLNSRNTLKTGVFIDWVDYNLLDSVYLQSLNRWVTLTDFKGSNFLFQPYVQYKLRVTEKLTLNAGVHGLYFKENQTGSIEPRLGIKQQIGNRNTISLGYGLHSQLQPLFVYFAQRPGPSGIYLPNHEMKPSKSHHIVLAWDHQFSHDIRLKVETYYQYIFNAGIENAKSSSFSLLNTGADFWTITPDSMLSNNGEGKNKGAEITFEKFLSKNYYFLYTLSVYDSKYKGSDDIWRNTAFNGQYATNLLTGGDIPLQKDKKWILGLNGKVTVAGGKRYTPLDVTLSKLYHRSVYLDSLAWTSQTKPYFRTDVRFSLRWNSPTFSQELAFDISNLFNTKNVQFQIFDKSSDRIRDVYQLGRLPVIQYKIEF